MAGLAYEMYSIMKDYIEKIINNDWMGPNSKLAIIGGIMLNCDGDGTDMFVPLSFELKSNKGNMKKDLFEETFGE